MSVLEVNCDGLVGPTHNYAGLARGNLASQANVRRPSNPREAARQGLTKIKRLHELGVRQAILPPHERPAVHVLHALGFCGQDEVVLRTAFREARGMFSACCSASAMWAANAATVSPGADTPDGRVHLTPANLASQFHRSIETETTARVLRKIFEDDRFFAHHAALPCVESLGDEGAANHTRLSSTHEDPGVELFVYGRAGLDGASPVPSRYPARQTLEASQAIARLHGLDRHRAIFAQQNPEAIDAGMFHADVSCVGNENVFLFHERAFLDRDSLLTQLKGYFAGSAFFPLEVAERRVTLGQAVGSYVFNSQLVTLPDKAGMALIAPRESEAMQPVRDTLSELVDGDNPISRLEFVDLDQSMHNGGGPACLRLRILLTEEQLSHVQPNVVFDDGLNVVLADWIDRHYRDRLGEEDLVDPQLLTEARQALDELTQILGLGSCYHFQR